MATDIHLRGIVGLMSTASKNMTYATCDYPLTSETESFAIVAIVGIIVASTAVLMRLANRALDRKIGLDDYVLIFTLVRESFRLNG